MSAVLNIALLVAVVVAVNGAALAAGEGQRGLLYSAATVCGGLGLFCLVALFIACVDFLIQIWIPRPGYAGEPVFVFLYGLVAATGGSLVTAVAVVWRERRERQRCPSAR